MRTRAVLSRQSFSCACVIYFTVRLFLPFKRLFNCKISHPLALTLTYWMPHSVRTHLPVRTKGICDGMYIWTVKRKETNKQTSKDASKLRLCRTLGAPTWKNPEGVCSFFRISLNLHAKRRVRTGTNERYYYIISDSMQLHLNAVMYLKQLDCSKTGE